MPRVRSLGRHLTRVAAISTVVLAVAAAAAVARPGPAFYGANIQPLIKYSFVSPARRRAFIAVMSRDGLRTARMDATWYWVERDAPTPAGHDYVWNDPRNPQTSMDGLVTMLAAAHVRLEAVLDSPPPWAQGPGTQLAPSFYGDFAAFAGAFAARYGAHGSFWRQHPTLPYLPVLDFEVWDEANSSRFWSAPPDAAAYSAVLAATSAAIHANDPRGQVLASIGWEGFAQYVGALYATGVGHDIDGIGFHPYAPDAPGIIKLNQQLRAALVATGAAATPIYDTETGQPVVSSGPGAPYAYDGEVSDATRAATESLAGDALARSDCGVDDYLIFGLTGSGTDLEPNGEGFMGIYSAASGRPDLTGAALIAAERRWRKHPASGLVLCGTGATRARDLLPLGLRLTRPGPTCVGASVSYRGQPLEGAEVVLRASDGRVDPAPLSNAFGQTRMCLQNGPPIKHFTAQAEIVNVASSNMYRCPVSTGACTPSGRGRAR